MVFLYKDKEYTIDIKETVETSIDGIEYTLNEIGFTVVKFGLEIGFWWDLDSNDMEITVLDMDELECIPVIILDFPPQEEKMLREYFKTIA